MEAEVEPVGQRGLRGTAVIALALLLSAASAVRFSPSGPDELEVYPSPSVSRKVTLSRYNPALQGTAGDAPVLIYEGAEPGGAVLVVGGAHPDEPAGTVAALVLAENAVVTQGKLIVIPYANASGFTHNLPQEGHPPHYTLRTPGGDRVVRFGSRLTNPVHQWPDPTVYIERVSHQKLAGTEARNLNRAYPGVADGSLTERVAYAITQLISDEGIDVSIDLHESSPEYPVNNAIVSHERALDLAAIATINLEMEGVQINIEPSPPTLRGLSHREWGDNTDTLALLLESPNPAQGRLRGVTDGELIVGGLDPMYIKASERGRLHVPYTDEGTPLAMRVARHLASVQVIVESYSMLEADRAIGLHGLPSYDEVLANGAGAYLNPSK
jgi:hypothetical protein